MAPLQTSKHKTPLVPPVVFLFAQLPESQYTILQHNNQANEMRQSLPLLGNMQQCLVSRVST